MKTKLLACAICLLVPSLASAGETCPQPQPFAPGVISRPNTWEWRLALSPERNLAVWSVGDFFAGGQLTVLTSEYRNGGWSEPVVAPFSGVYDDLDTAFSPDGRTLYFISRRPLHPGEPPRPDFDLWKVSHGARGWGTPVHLGSGPNSAHDETYPSIDRDGNLYFGSDRDGGQWDIYRSMRRADGSFGPAAKLGAGVNSPDYWEFNPEVSPNGKTLLFTSLGRPGGYGWGDLYRSNLRDGGFTVARNLGPCINSNADDYHATMLWDEGVLIYVRNFIEDPNWYPDFFSLPLDLD